MAWRWAPAAGAWRHGTKSGCVGCGLGAKLSKIEIGSSAVTLSHGLPELPLGPEAVENNGVDGNAKNFDNNLDDGANKRPTLEAAKEAVLNIVLEEMLALVVQARPTPQIFVVIVHFALVEDTCSDSPHDDAEDEEANCKDGVVSGNFLGSVMTSSEISEKDNDGHGERDAGNDEK